MKSHHIMRTINHHLQGGVTRKGPWKKNDKTEGGLLY